MAEISTISALVGGFIATAILLVIGIQILGNVQTSTNCNNLPGFNTTGLVNGTGSFGSSPGSGATVALPAADFKYSGWSLSCLSNNNAVQNAYTLLIVILIIIAAVAILYVVKLI